MPLLFILPIVGLGSGWLGSIIGEKNAPAPIIQNATVSPGLSYGKLALYAATGIGGFLLWKKLH